MKEVNGLSSHIKVSSHKAQIKRMNNLQKNEAKLWADVSTYLQSKGSNSYDNAAKTLKDLYDMSLFFNEKDDFMQKYKPIFLQCQKSKALMDRFVKLRLPNL
jgi:hypothetical protein